VRPDGTWTYVFLVTEADKRGPIRILLAETHPAARAGLRRALRDDRFEIVAEAEDASEAVAAALAKRPDICVLDADMPGDAVRATAAITRDLPQAAVVIMAAHRGEEAMLEAVRAGAAGYLYKDMDHERLRFALRGVTEGEAALPRKLVARLMQEFRLRERGRRLPLASGRDVELTSREWAVLELLADGASTREAGSALGISEVTVRRHVSSASAKLGVAGRREAVAALRAARAV
jgi:DNA-binding NarL/FixJ family response regulator